MKNRQRKPKYRLSEIEKLNPLTEFIQYETGFWILIGIGAIASIISVLEAWLVTTLPSPLRDAVFVSWVGIIAILAHLSYKHIQYYMDLMAVFGTDEGQKIAEIIQTNRPLFKAAKYEKPIYLAAYGLSGGELSRYQQYYEEMQKLLKQAYIAAGLAIDEEVIKESLLLESRLLRESRMQELALQHGATLEEWEAATKELNVLKNRFNPDAR